MVKLMRPNQSIRAAMPRRIYARPGATSSASGSNSGSSTASPASGDQASEASMQASATSGRWRTKGIGCTSRYIGGRRLAIHQIATGQAGNANHRSVLP